MFFLCRIKSIIQSINRVARGPRAQGPKSPAFRAVVRNAPQEMDRSIGEEEIDSSRMIAGKIVQAAVGVRGDIDPVIVCQDESLRWAGGVGPNVRGSRSANGAIGRAGPDAIRLRPGPVAEQDGLARSISNV